MTVKCCRMLREKIGIQEAPLTIMEGMNKLNRGIQEAQAVHYF